MREKKQFGKNKRILSLLLAIVMMCGMIPVEPIFALENETSQETEGLLEVKEEVEQDSASESDSETSEGTEMEPAESPERESTESTEPETYANSISGMLWLDMFDDIDNSIYAGDAIRQVEEQPLAGYTVSLYKANDTSNAVQTTLTDAEGNYEFVNVEPSTYVVGITTSIIDEIEYLLPLAGIKNNNKFVIDTSDWIYAYTDLIEVQANNEITGIDAGLRTPPEIQLFAGPYDAEIDLVTGAIIGDNTGITVTTSLITFATGTNGKNYRLYGTTTARTISVSTGVTTTITLDGVNITSAIVSPLQLNGTANVTLHLADGMDNDLICTGTTSTSAGIGVSYTSVTNYSSLTIEGATGTLTAQGSIYGAGIGGAGASVIGVAVGETAGTVVINGGMVTAAGGGYGAGIGGGFGFGGASFSRPGIGTGGAGGAVTISGGTVTATSNASAGIGGGSGYGSTGNMAGTGTGGVGGTVTITGGTVTATCEGGISGVGTGIGGGGGNTVSNVTTGTNVFISGSIYPTNASGVSVATSTRNGGGNGNVLVYMTAVTVKDIDGSFVPNALVTIKDNRTSGYEYTAYTNAQGVAYVWVPLQTLSGSAHTLYEAESNGRYSFEYGQVTSNNNVAVTIIFGMRTTLSRIPDTITFITSSDPEPVTLNIKAENKGDGLLKETIEVEWFRVETTDSTVYSTSDFSTGYTSAASGNSGTITTGTVTSTDGITGFPSETIYELPVSENGTYWARVHYKDGNGNDMYQVKSIVIDNIYTQVTGKWKGINTIDSSIMYDESLPDLLIKELVGVAFELNSTSDILYSTVDGTTAEMGTGAQISVAAKNLGSAWMITSTNPLTANVTGAVIGTFEFQYSLDPSAITVKFDPQGGTPATIADQYYLPADNFLLPLPTVSQASYTFEGWFDAPTGGNEVNPTGTDTVGGLFPSASGGVVTLYARWKASTIDLKIDKMVTGLYGDRNKEFEITITLEDNGTPVTGTYSYTGSAISGVTAPANGSITFNVTGQGTISLKHGQAITITGLIQGHNYTVQETDAAVTSGLYAATYSGTGTVSGSGDSISDTLGSTTATASITNDRSTVPTTGLSGTNYRMAVVGILTVLAVAVTMLWSYRKRRKCR